MEHRIFSEASDLAQGLIAQWHEHLTNTDIVYLAVDEMKSRRRETWAKIRKANPVESCLADADLILVVNEGIWQQLNLAQRIALLDHEFCHVVWDAESGKLVMRDHDLEEFACIVKRHGAWRDSIKLFGEQLELFDPATLDQSLNVLGSESVKATLSYKGREVPLQ